jgi:hypothetical protein
MYTLLYILQYYITKKLRLYHVGTWFVVKSLLALSYLMQRVIWVESPGWFVSRNPRVATRNTRKYKRREHFTVLQKADQKGTFYTV